MKKISLLIVLLFCSLPAFAQQGTPPGAYGPGGGSGSGSGVAFAIGGGTAQAQTVAPTTAITNATLAAYATAAVNICWLPAAANTAAAPTLAGSGTSTFTAKPITKYGTVALIANDITTAGIACVIYDGTEFQLQIPLTGPAPAVLPTTPNSVPYILSSTPAGGIAVAPVFTLPGVAGRSNAGATDAIVAADRGTIITETNAGAIAVSLPQAGSTNFTSNFYFGIIVTGDAAIATITPATSQIAINGKALAATLVLPGHSVTYCYSFDNANYQCTMGATVPESCVQSGGSWTCNSNNFFANNLTALAGVKIDNNNFGNLIQQSVATSSARTTQLPDASINVEGGFCVNTTPVTLPGTNTTADQNLMACTITAKALNLAGRTIRVHAKDVYTTVAGNLSTITRKFKLCSVSGCASGNVTTLVTITSSAQVGTITNDPIILDAIATTTTAGAASRFEASGDLIIDLAAATTAAESTFLDTNTGTLAGTPSDLDITAQIFLQSTISFSIGNAGNLATERQMTVEIIN